MKANLFIFIMFSPIYLLTKILISERRLYLKINSYQIGMDSAGTYRSTQTGKFSLSYTKTNENDDNSLGTSFMEKFEDMNADMTSRVKEVEKGDSLKTIDQVRERFVLYLWRMFFGQTKADELADRFGMDRLKADSGNQITGPSSGFSVIKLQGIKETFFTESQELSFSSAGSVTTEDGKTIDFNLDISMSRSFSRYYREEVTSVAGMFDPLVINFSGNPADLTDTKFRFDLNCDGEDDEISTLSNGSGFLALDKNSDGVINDGSELFGTSSGDGFKDLAFYDKDGNGWIDENDDIYDSLKIWVKDLNGNDALYSLKDKNVGAIYLGSVDTNLILRSETSGKINGALRRSGLFLYEDGSGAGLMSHLDIAN